MDIVMTNIIYSIGDVVRLKSGGPMMTVTGRAQDDHYICNWFADSQLLTGVLPSGSLCSKAVIDAQEAAYLASIDAALC